MKWLAEKYLKWRGWEFTGEVPDIPRLVIIGAPHTTNWDFIAFLAALRHYDMAVKFIGKHTLFRWPFGYFFRSVGGIPVDRSRPGGLVKQVVDALEEEKRAVLVMAPEGTRSPAPYWKDGFLRIADGLGAPVLFASIDFPSKMVGMGPLVRFEGDVTSFMDTVRVHYADKEGLHHEGKGPICIKSELAG